MHFVAAREHGGGRMRSGGASRWRIVYHMARADFLERVRRYSFLVTLGFAMYLGYLAATGKLVLQFGEYYGVHNSAYIGGFVAYVTAAFLSLAGFYFVKNTVERDRQTRVGQILAASSITKLDYCAGKWGSNFATLLAMVSLLAIAALGMYVLNGDGSGLNFWKLFAPFLFFGVPAMAVVSALALLFEVVRGLQGGLGNIVYFFVWNGLLLLGISGGLTPTPHPFLDFTGCFTLWHSLSTALSLAYPGAELKTFALTVGSAPTTQTNYLHWNGYNWTPEILLSRLFWFGFALAIAFSASLLFDRFDPAHGKPPRESGKPERAAAEESNLLQIPAHAPVLTALASARPRFRFGAMLSAEVRLMLKGQKWWWYVISLGLVVASAAVPSADARGYILGCAWIWPVLLWSTMGVREERDRTSQLLFSAPHPIARQLPAVWLAGFVLAVITGGGFALRLLIDGNTRGLLAWLIGAIFIPSFALALGSWSGSSKPFEILYTLLWYLGPMHQISRLDFMGSAPITATTRYPLDYLLLTGGLLLAAWAGRKRQLQT
jgi:hypothetical protein